MGVVVRQVSGIVGHVERLRVSVAKAHSHIRDEESARFFRKEAHERCVSDCRTLTREVDGIFKIFAFRIFTSRLM